MLEKGHIFECVVVFVMTFIFFPLLFYSGYKMLCKEGVEAVKYSFFVNMNSGEEYIIDEILVGKCDSNKKCVPFSVMAKEHGCTRIKAMERTDTGVKITCTNFVEGIKQ